TGCAADVRVLMMH
ncbi:hypothetical protein V495_07991, partial [Pseudogymnoascus sp. VKM F-4514 (FW-929)]